MNNDPKAKPSVRQAVPVQAPISVNFECIVKDCYDSKLRDTFRSEMESTLKKLVGKERRLKVGSDSKAGFFVEFTVTKLTRDGEEKDSKIITAISVKVTGPGKTGPVLTANMNGQGKAKPVPGLSSAGYDLVRAVTESLWNRNVLFYILNGQT